MILELLEYLLTPCSSEARALGFLRSSIEVRARFKRCRAAWEPHLAETRRCILEAAEGGGARRRALLLGAGLLHDIPLEELCGMFEEVILADIVHTLPCRLRAARHPNVRLCALDLTGVAAELSAALKNPALPLPVSRPVAFLRESDLDLVVSVNLLSQLGWVPGRLVDGRRGEVQLQAFRRQLVEAHLEYLGKFAGRSVLITDVRWRAEEMQGECLEEWDVVQGVVLPEPDRFWDWCIAPAPELARGRDHIARVHAYMDWGGRFEGGRGQVEESQS